MLYHLYDLQHALLTPARLTAELTRDFYSSPWNPLSFTQAGRTIAANAEMVERVTRRFGKPDFGLNEVSIDGHKYDVTEQRVLEKPFCSLLHFKRELKKKPRKDPQVLIVAPMSGHYATLLRGTVEALLPHHDVYITDWHDARQIPASKGRFNLDDYIAYLIEFMSLLGPDTHIIAVCQPAVPVFASVALMESWKDPNSPRSMTLMGGPIDTRVSKTQVTELAETRPIEWFENSVVNTVPFYYPGGNRRVYPGFIQLGGFMSMNLDRHIGSHFDFYRHLIAGDGGSAGMHRKFYNEYLSVMDITAEFYLQTVETVFQKQSLPKGEMMWTNPDTGETHRVDPKAIKKTTLLTIEGELDDISAHGQTTAANVIASSLPANKSYHHFQENVGHYGIFNGSKWREHIMPRIRHMIRKADPDTDPVPAKDLELIADKKPAQWDEDVHGIDAVRKRLKAEEGKKAKDKQSENA